MPRARSVYKIPEWRKPRCLGDYDETCITNLQEGCQWMEECKASVSGKDTRRNEE